MYESETLKTEQLNVTALKSGRLPIVPRLFYFAWYITVGVYYPFITLYYRERGLDFTQIGYILALPGIAQMIAGPLWGLLADTLRLHRILLPIAIVGTVIPAALIGGFHDFTPILLLATLTAVFSIQIAPLSDTATLALLGERRAQYGSLRVWGAVGWGISTVVAGVIVERMGLSVIFWIYPVFGFLTFLAALALPKVPFTTAASLAAVRMFLRDARWVRYMACVLLIGSASALMNGFLSIYLSELGAGRDQVGLAYMIASLSEMPVMVLATIVLRRWGAKPLLVCAGLSYAVRLMIYAIFPDPTIVLAAQLLHGFCFGALWIAGVHEAQRLAPPGLAATSQSLFGTTTFGVAVVLANLVGGRIYQNAGSATLFGTAAALALLGALGFLLPIGKEETTHSA